MPIKAREEKLKGLITQWVSRLTGTLANHVSDTFLIALLFEQTRKICASKENYEARNALAYQPAILIFETVLQNGCSLDALSGHDVANDFARTITENLQLSF